MSEVQDYTDFTYYEMPIAERRKAGVGDIFMNQVRCKKCGWIIRSKNRHHMVYCKCRATAVDGGSWYSKVTAEDINDVEWLTLYYRYRPRKKGVSFPE